MPEVILVLVKNGDHYSTAVVPFKVAVPYGQQKVTWQAAGPNARFPSSNYFWWKTNPPPLDGQIPTRSADGQTLTLEYGNEGSPAAWVYGVTVENNDTSIGIDPEVDNGPPRDR
jgi:hypothetical protein